MNQKVWVVNVYEEDIDLFASKEKAIKAVEHNYKLVWEGDTAEGFHKFNENFECAELSIYPKGVL